MDRIQKELASELTIEDIPDSHRPIVELIGLEKFILLCEYAMGDELYFLRVDKILMPARNRRIRKEYNGYNKKELAQKYDLTIQQIKNIIRNI